MNVKKYWERFLKKFVEKFTNSAYEPRFAGEFFYKDKKFWVQLHVFEASK